MREDSTGYRAVSSRRLGGNPQGRRMNSEGRQRGRGVGRRVKFRGVGWEEEREIVCGRTERVREFGYGLLRGNSWAERVAELGIRRRGGKGEACGRENCR